MIESAPATPAARSQYALFKPLDILVLALVLAGGIKTLPWLWTGTGHTAVVTVDGKKIMRLQMQGKTRHALVMGAIGPVDIAWGDTGARVFHAPCPNQICMRTGWIKRQGHRIICVPSHLEIAVEPGPGASLMDAVTF